MNRKWTTEWGCALFRNPSFITNYNWIKWFSRYKHRWRGNWSGHGCCAYKRDNNFEATILGDVIPLENNSPSFYLHFLYHRKIQIKLGYVWHWKECYVCINNPCGFFYLMPKGILRFLSLIIYYCKNFISFLIIYS